MQDFAIISMIFVVVVVISMCCSWLWELWLYKYHSTLPMHLITSTYHLSLSTKQLAVSS